MNFSDVIGQSFVVKRLKQIIESQRIGHAYLFVGSKGIGKKTIANIFARGIMCKSQGHRPCDLCRSCRQFNSGNHPDVYRVQKGDKSSIGVEQIRNVLEDIHLKPYESSRKVYIIEDAHAMTVQAQNAFLKTLEEPPFFATIILLAEKSSELLPTILSRCQVFRMQRLTREEVCTIIISHFDMPRERAMLFAGLSGGIPGKGLQLAGSQEFNQMRSDVFKFLEEIFDYNDIDKMTQWELFNQYKDRIDEILDMLVIWFRDILSYKETGDSALVINIDKLPVIEKQASLFTIRRIRSIIESIERTRRMLKGNANYQLTIENLLLNM
ncbi:DNA polymerase III subunit delta' [Caldicoprobacter algeriensis]|uniref:DNA polymerase III subunit delta' n=1 Tax=Caldicoprobacter algeriensis TaxID=699281 RepID=UPI002079DE46|nr:DNA polymerase III subunit delta' [Caldicoprobacter algeriensis]MCM8901858.1 DNA polymerase III subunit delta' [Caldicoprobacter algeriensis]